MVATEVIVDDVWENDEKGFIERLADIFREFGEKLEENGLIVFAFDHQEERVWELFWTPFYLQIFILQQIIVQELSTA